MRHNRYLHASNKRTILHILHVVVVVVVVLVTLTNVSHGMWSVSTLKPDIEDQPQGPSQSQRIASNSKPHIVPHCTLGDDTFQIGERWNPNLPPFGVQVCVVCECTIRQKKSCYETKVTCRRITNECPVIDSCPDGKRPATVPGQCCKSCQGASQASGATQLQDIYQQSTNQTALTSSANTQQASPASQESYRFVYMNERTKDYLTMIKNLPLCPTRDGDSSTGSSGSGSGGGGGGGGGGVATPTPKTAKNVNKNDLNGIDTRLAFKSLHDIGPNSLVTPKSRNSHSQASAASADARHGRPEESLHTDQHPNDVQQSSANNSNRQSNEMRNSNQQAASSQGIASSSSSSGSSSNQYIAPHCTLGDDTFQVGERWNPNLPPFGVQVCVVCECIVRQKKSCYETKVTCRRITNECPVVESCPDGKRPVTVAGQCCKSCQSGSGQASSATQVQDIYQQSMSSASSSASLPQKLSLASLATPQQAGSATQESFRFVYMNERTKDYLTMIKSLPLCPSRDGKSSHDNGPPKSRSSRSQPPPSSSSEGRQGRPEEPPQTDQHPNDVQQSLINESSRQRREMRASNQQSASSFVTRRRY